MRYVDVAGVKVSAIGVGTWQFGREWGYGKRYLDTTAIDIVHRALELGVNLIDTAEAYGLGTSERVVGRAIAGRREHAFVATKVFPVLPLAPVVEQRGRASAKRLGVETIDLYQVHWPNPLVPIGTTMDGMRRLQKAGVVRHVGVSNFSTAQWQAAEDALGSPVLSNQVEYSLVQRAPEAALAAHAEANDRLIIAWSPLAQGFLSTRYSRSHLPGGFRMTNPLFSPENLDRAEPLFDALRDVAAAHGVTPAQVALAWVLRRPNVVAIPGASSVEQLEANVAAATLELTDDEDRRLTDASDLFVPRRGPAAWPGMLLARLRR